MTFLKTASNLLSGGASTAFSFLGGIRTYLIIAAVCSLLGTAGGFYWGASHQAGIMANAAVQAAEKARKSQADKDAKDWETAKEDYEARLHIAEGANEALADLLNHKNQLVPNPSKAKVSAQAMRALNDPKLVGDTE